MAALVLGLALLVSACGIGPTGGGGGTTSTPTPKPTATATPVPCTTWRIVSSPNTASPPYNSLSAVATFSPTNAWAVGGSFTDGGPARSLIEQWDGTSWHITSSPGIDGLNAVAALSASDVWAVGSLINHQPRPSTLIEHWNGTQWSIVTSPNPGPLSDTLNAVVAIAASDVWAVGESVTGNNATQPLILRWNGTKWQVVSSAVPAGATASHFNAITRIAGTSQLWAVGSVRIGPPPTGALGYFQPLIERWDGTAWQIIASPALPAGAFAGELKGVVALSTTDAWAVGDYTARDHTNHTFIAHWDGSAWKMATSPDGMGTLSSVAASNSHDVRAVGYLMSDEGSRRQPLIERWDGTAWQVMTSPEPTGSRITSLNGITTDSAGNFWVVGSWTGADRVSKTLTLHCL
ncbi:MAG TPA: hypothetical protein VGF38_14250 [Ktedonobacterales bacterium]